MNKLKLAYSVTNDLLVALFKSFYNYILDLFRILYTGKSKIGAFQNYQSDSSRRAVTFFFILVNSSNITDLIINHHNIINSIFQFLWIGVYYIWYRFSAIDYRSRDKDNRIKYYQDMNKSTQELVLRSIKCIKDITDSIHTNPELKKDPELVVRIMSWINESNVLIEEQKRIAKDHMNNL